MRILAFIVLLLVVSFPALAGVEGNANENEKSAGKTFLPLANEFGMEEYVFAGRATPISILYEYLPKGQNVDSWKDMATMTLYAPSPKPEETLTKIIDGTKKALEGKIKNSRVYGSGISKVGFFEYEIGTGSITEHSLNMTWLVAPGMVGVFQVQKRDGKPTQETKDQFLELVKKTANPQ